MAKRFPWKRNYLIIPPFVQSALNDIDGDFIAVAATKKIKREDIEAGQYSHAGLSIDGSFIIAVGPTHPLPMQESGLSGTLMAGTVSVRIGRWSRRHGPSSHPTSGTARATAGQCVLGQKTFTSTKFLNRRA